VTAYSPQAAAAARQRRLRARAVQLAEALAASVGVDFHPGARLTARAEGPWSDAEITLATDLLGESGWLRVEIRRAEGSLDVLALMDAPSNERTK
jgi:hypothetical protein